MARNSFSAFQKIFTSGESIAPITESLTEDDIEHTAHHHITDPDPEEESLAQKFPKRKKFLGFAADSILASLHSHDNLRDAIIDTVLNLENNSVLFVVNPQMQDTKELIYFFHHHPRVKQIGLGGKTLDNGDKVRVVKAKVINREEVPKQPQQQQAAPNMN